ncbi:MAG: DUF4339 domain-containing protein [Gemmataceae bacterium]|nr:DUF4339 domain-containing protein [Gemmataceae bacterium]
MSDKWFYAKGKQKHGPVSESELNGLAHSGQLAPTDMVWKEGMAEWKPATSIPGIFTPGIPGNTVSEDLGNAAKEVAHAGATVAKAGQKFISRIGTFADKVGNIAGEAVVFDQTLPTKPHEPAIFLRELYFGGRRHIGGSLDQMRTMGGKIMAAVFSFFYIGLMLHFPLSSRQFLPYSKAELVQITLRQKLRWEKLVPILIAWFVTVVVGLLMSFLWGFLVAMLITQVNLESVTAKVMLFLAILSPWIFLAFIVFANLAACKKVARLENYKRSCIIVHYGFPNKTRLLVGVSDADVEKQMEGVLALCDAIAKANFAPWDNLSAKRNLGIRNYVASLARRITGQ